MTTPAPGDYVYTVDVSDTSDHPDGSSRKSTIGSLGGPVYNIVSFGAVGDGSTDDTTAIQAAFDAAGTARRPVYIPGTSDFYKITSALTMPDVPGFAIFGDGGNSIIRQATASANGINANSSGTRRAVTFRDFVIGVDGSTTQGGTGLNLVNITDSHFENVAVVADNTNQGFLTGFRVYTDTGGGAYRNEFMNCKSRTIDNASAVGVLFGGATNTSSNSNHWRGGQIRADSGIGLHITDNGTEISNQNVIDQCSFEGSTATAISLENAQTNVICYCRFEGPTTAIALDTNCSDNVSLFNLFTSGVTAYSKAGNSVQENFFLDCETDNLNRTMELGGGHYKVTAPQDVTRAMFDVEAGTVSWPAYGTRVSSDSNMRLEVRVDGQLEWGNGSAASDVGLRRSATGILEVILGNLDANNKLIIDGGAAGPTVTTGSGSPESSVTAPPGSIYTDTGGGASTTLYVKESGTGNTGWVAK